MTSGRDLAGFAVLADLTDQQREAVAVLARPASFPAGVRIFDEGHAADRCWLLRTGRVALQTHRPGGPAIVVETLGPGEVLGWSWLVPPYRWRFDAVATGPVDALELDAAKLRELARQDTSLGYPLALRLLAAVADRLHATRARLLDVYGSPRDA